MSRCGGTVMRKMCLLAPFFVVVAWFLTHQARQAGKRGNHMRKILVALPCLLFSGVVLAKQAPAPEARGADGVLMATAFDASHGQREAAIRLDGTLEAATKKKKGQAAAKPAAAPVELAPESKRFNMTQDGKKMTADDFDAWMKKNGYRVATGAPAAPKEEEPKKGGK